MGTAEQRQVERGDHGAVQAATLELARRYTGPLGYIRKHRDIEIDREERLRGASRGVRAAVGMVIQQPDPPSDAEVLEAAGWTPGQLAELRASLAVSHPG